ncbi:MAG TPA: RsiV family protein [Aggregatilineaceae bacterium]|nr:RsiV family protein [Aggregatilineaceae bacterium]
MSGLCAPTIRACFRVWWTRVNSTAEHGGCAWQHDEHHLTDTNRIHQGTGENPDNYKSWTITPDGLTFYFDPYQVAAYVAGTQTVTIPLAQLSAILAAPFNGAP